MCENKRTGYGLKHAFSQLFPAFLIPLTMNVGLLITLKTHSLLVIPFIFLFCGYFSGSLPLLFHLFFLCLSHWQRTNASFPSWFSLLLQELHFSPVISAGQLLPCSKAAPGTVPWPLPSPVWWWGCCPEEPPQLLLSGSFWPLLLYLPYFPCAQICASVAKSVVVDETDHRSVTE